MDMRKYLGVSILSVTLLMASAIPGLAKDSRTVTLPHSAVLSGMALPAGQYLVRWEPHSSTAAVEFAQHNKVVLSTESTLVDRGQKYASNTIVYETSSGGTLTISEIRIGGTSKVLVFNQ
jgi:hypothetical protein